MIPLVNRSSTVIPVPLVSIIITNFNYSRYLPEALRSVAAQNYQNFECIIVDDHSNDESIAVINQTLAILAVDRFTLIRNDTNLGQLGSIKVGLTHAKGEFVTFLDADDILMPEFISQHIRAHTNSIQSVGTTSSDTIQINDTGSIIEGTYSIFPKTRLASIKPDAVLPRDSLGHLVASGLQIPNPADIKFRFIARSVDGWHGVATSAFMFRKNLVDLIMPDDTSILRVCADGYLVKFAHYISGTVAIGEALGCYRLHSSNLWANNLRIGGGNKVGIFTLRQMAAVTGLMRKHLKKRNADFVRALGRLEQKKLACRLFFYELEYRIGHYIYD